MKPKVIERINSQDKNLDDKIKILNDDRGYLNTKNLVSIDINSITSNGFYKVDNSCKNQPIESDWGYLKVVLNFEGYCTQEFTSYNNKQYLRNQIGGVWSPWQQIASIEDVNRTFKERGYFTGDMNTLITQGSYLCFPEGTNVPVKYSWGTVNVFLGGTGSIIQEWISATDYSRYYRHFGGTEWTPWKQIVTSEYSMTLKDIPSGTTRIADLPTGYYVYWGTSTSFSDYPTYLTEADIRYGFIQVIQGGGGSGKVFKINVISGSAHEQKCIEGYMIGGMTSIVWNETATTTKKSFSCTAMSGYTIHQQDCYKINNHVYINVWIKPDAYGFTPNSQRACFSSPYFNLSISNVGIVTYWANVNGGMYLSSNAGTMHLDGVAWLNLGASADQYINFKCDFEL